MERTEEAIHSVTAPSYESRAAQASPQRGGQTVPLVWLLLIVTAGLLLRWKHILNVDFELTGDDGVVALMGLHILRGQEFPLVFYGQHYMGTPDAFSAALLYHWFGVSARTYKLTILVYAGLALGLFGWAAWRLWGWACACLAVGLLAFAPAAIRWQIDATNYGMLFLFAAGLMVVTVHLLLERERSAGAWPLGVLCGWSFLAGFACWAHSLVIALLLPLPFLLWLRRDLPPKKSSILAGTSFCLGVSPLLIHNILYPLATFRQFAGFFLNVSSRSDVQDQSVGWVLLKGLWSHVDPTLLGTNLLTVLRGPGFGANRSLYLMGYVAMAVLVSLVLSAAVGWVRGARKNGWREWLASREGMVLSWLLLSAATVVFLGGTRARYMALLVPILSLLIVGPWSGSLLGRRAQCFLSVCLVLYVATASVVLNVVRPVIQFNPVPALAKFIMAKGLTLGYAGYELAYPLTFHTQETVRLSPLAGPIIDDLYPEYTEAVEQASSPFYIYEENESLGKDLARYLRESGTKFEMTLVWHHLVFWGFSRPVKPDEFFSGSYLARYRQAHR